MALTQGQQIALYLLMGKHQDSADGKSWLRTYVETNGTAGSYAPALRAAAQQLDSGIADTDINDLADLNAASIRAALGTLVYSGTGPCLNKSNCQAVYDALTA